MTTLSIDALKARLSAAQSAAPVLTEEQREALRLLGEIREAEAKQDEEKRQALYLEALGAREAMQAADLDGVYSDPVLCKGNDTVLGYVVLRNDRLAVQRYEKMIDKKSGSSEDRSRLLVGAFVKYANEHAAPGAPKRDVADIVFGPGGWLERYPFTLMYLMSACTKHAGFVSDAEGKG